MLHFLRKVLSQGIIINCFYWITVSYVPPPLLSLRMPRQDVWPFASATSSLYVGWALMVINCYCLIVTTTTVIIIILCIISLRYSSLFPPLKKRPKKVKFFLLSKKKIEVKNRNVIFLRKLFSQHFELVRLRLNQTVTLTIRLSSSKSKHRDNPRFLGKFLFKWRRKQASSCYTKQVVPPALPRFK